MRILVTYDIKYYLLLYLVTLCSYRYPYDLIITIVLNPLFT